MSLFLIFNLFMVYITQIAVVVVLKLGSYAKSRKWKFACFAAGNIISFISMYFAVPVYAELLNNANMAAALIVGGTFVAGQLGLWAVFRDKLSPLKFAGILLTAAGLFLTALAA